ncbi:hypothetical protein SNE35_12660 [Paucibacter sp. R3-3]|uniref:Uncharacterized protein n=1 Tax=Roseateles agri TaxID=3098619 RepID=A0ABU5DI24_9BURK|nr:hypothetical protein [Paucibacter sp. R3-3]MDY0745365.1 hypothetical protein [Paucibacter sp. R3-3]
MKGVEIRLQVQYRARVDESIEACHARFTAGMQQFGPPFGWQDLEPPPAPYIKPASGDMIGVEWFRYPIKGLKLQITAQHRHELSIGTDKDTSDDRLSIEFKTSNKALDYRAILREHFPKLIEAYRGYRAWAVFDYYGGRYTDWNWGPWLGREATNPSYQRLCKEPGVDIDGRNNIFTLEPAVFWDNELCRRALGYGPEEVMRRLQGHALSVQPLLDGVYVVFDDDPALTYERFLEINKQFKELLGIA